MARQTKQGPEILAEAERDDYIIAYLRLSTGRQLEMVLAFDKQGEPVPVYAKVKTAEEVANLLGAVAPGAKEDVNMAHQYNVYRPRREITAALWDRLEAILREYGKIAE